MRQQRIFNDYQQELKDLRGGIEYCQSRIESGVEKWEEKEYRAVIEGHNERIKKIEAILSTPGLFDDNEAPGTGEELKFSFN